MVTHEQETCDALDLNLSLGGVFSHFDSPLKHSHSQIFHQHKKARTPSYQKHTSDGGSSSHLDSRGSCNLPTTSNPQCSSFRSDNSMIKNGAHSSNIDRNMLSDAKKAMVADQVHNGFGPTTAIIHKRLPSKRNSSFENEEGMICPNDSTESENGDNGRRLVERNTSQKKAQVQLEAPRSRCGSNSDLLGSVDSADEKSSHSFMMYTHPSSDQMLPVRGPYSVPAQWGFSRPHRMPHSSFPWIAPVTCELRPGIPEASCCDSKLQETFIKEAACEAGHSLKNKVPEDVPHIREIPVVPTLCKTVPMAKSEMCTSASSLQPSYSMSPTANYSTDVGSSLRQSLMSATSLVNDCSCDSFKQMALTKEQSRLNAGFSCPAQEGCFQPVLCPLESYDTGPHGNSMCVQSKHSSPTAQKPTKTVRFCCNERDFVKFAGNDKKMFTSSSANSRNQLVKKMQAFIGKKGLWNLRRQNGSVTIRAAEGCEKEEESEDSQITSESSNKEKLALLGKDEGGAGKHDTQFAAGWPRVSTTCAGMNGKTIHGVMYITKSKQVCLICSCHGIHMSPSEFVQHSGSTDLRNPERSIMISGLSDVKHEV